MRTFRMTFSVSCTRSLRADPTVLGLAVDVKGVNETDALTRFFTHAPIRYVPAPDVVMYLNPSAIQAVTCTELHPEVEPDDPATDVEQSPVVIKFPTRTLKDWT